MICEVCGKSDARGYRVRMEGTVLQACSSCSKGHDIVSEVRSEKKSDKTAPKPQKNPVIGLEAGYEIVDDYADIIKGARQRRGMTQDDLGRQINESHSLIHRLELGKLKPHKELAKKLERKLKISLLTEPEDAGEAPPESKTAEMTLGDLVVVRKRGK